MIACRESATKIRTNLPWVLGLSLRRLSQDMQAVHGYPILLAETFVDPARFAGTCYRASNWRSPGLTRGYAREPGGTARWRHHGQPKEVFVFELSENAAEALSQVETPAQWHGEPRTEAMAAPRLRSLFECPGRGARVPPCPGQALRVAHRAGARRRGTPCGLPRGHRVCRVCWPAQPGPARGRGRTLEREQTALHRAPRSPPSTTSSRRCRHRPWTTPSASGPASTAPLAPRSPWTGKTCEGPRSRPNRDAR